MVHRWGPTGFTNAVYSIDKLEQYLKTLGALMSARRIFITACAAALAAPAFSDPVQYDIEPTHSFPSFEADHMGMSVIRGRLNSTSGKIVLDKSNGSGTVDITIDLDSIDFGVPALHAWAVGPKFFDVEHFGSKATYKGKLAGFNEGGDPKVTGELTLHGVTKPVDLKVNFFRCRPHPLTQRDWCGADALAVFNREDFGLDDGKAYGFAMDVTMRIQVEANIRADQP